MYQGGKTIFDDFVRELRPRYLARRTYQRTVYRPGELCQFDLFDPRSDPGRPRPDPPRLDRDGGAWLLARARRCARVLQGGARPAVGNEPLPGKVGCATGEARLGSRGTIHAGGGRPTEEFAAFCGQLSVGSIILEPGDAEAKGLLERSHRFMRTNFEPARSFCSELDCQAQLERWTERANARTHRTIRAVPAERLAKERDQMRSFPGRMPHVDRRFVTRVPAAALSEVGHKRLLARPPPRRAPGRGPSHPARTASGGAGHG